MASRNLCEIYILLRNNSFQNKNYNVDDNNFEDKVSLYDGQESLGKANKIPKWLDIVQEINYEILKIQNKIKELNKLHQHHTNEPCFEENTLLESQIQSKSHQIIQMLSHSQALVKRIFTPSAITFIRIYGKEATLRKNITTHFVFVLCDLTSAFRKCQSSYLKQIERRDIYQTEGESVVRLPQFTNNISLEENNQPALLMIHDSGEAFDNQPCQFNHAVPPQVTVNHEVLVRQQKVKSINNGQPIWDTTSAYPRDESTEFSKEMSKENHSSESHFKLSKLISKPFFLEDDMYTLEREEEIKSLVKSITELNVIFNDLSQIIVDQGAVVDRIDYNLEQSSLTVKTGLKQLNKAESYQRKNRKIVCVMVLAAVVTVMSIALIILKF